MTPNAKRRRASNALPWAAILLLSSACDDNNLSRLPERAVQIDELAQQPAALVDILWVVDSSDSMREEQQALADNFDRFIGGLTLCQGTGEADDVCEVATGTCRISKAACNPPDYHIGVISMDITAASEDFDQGKLRKVGLCVPSQGSAPVGDVHRYCGGSSAECQEAADENRFCDLGQGITFVTPETNNGRGAFARAVDVGIDGRGLESGLAAAAIAVGRGTDPVTREPLPQPAENAGFLRDDAALFVIFVSDEDDQSFGEPTYFYRIFEALKGAGNEGLVSVSSIVGPPDLDGPTGPMPGGCDVPQPARPGTRYVSLGMYSRGVSDEFRACDNQRLMCGDGQTCSAPVPDLPGVCVPDGQCGSPADCGKFQCSDGPCIACDNGACRIPEGAFLELLAQNGVFGSICEQDYGPVLDALGFEAAGLARKFELTKGPDCNETVCCGAAAPDGECSDAEKVPICVKVDGEIIPNDRATGWVFEVASDSVFFDGDFVPPTDARLEIAYRIARGDRSLGCEGTLQ